MSTWPVSGDAALQWGEEQLIASGKLKKLGVRFLNPTKEQDYGVHIFEDAVTHELVGASPAGRYHLRCCGSERATLGAGTEGSRAVKPRFWETTL